MGVYDTFAVCDCDGQVKLYDNVMRNIHIGTGVADELDMPDHSVLLRNGKWANVVKGIYVSYTFKPECDVLLDKWGWEYETVEDAMKLAYRRNA